MVCASAVTNKISLRVELEVLLCSNAMGEVTSNIECWAVMTVVGGSYIQC
jgi:hypothetical protein